MCVIEDVASRLVRFRDAMYTWKGYCTNSGALNDQMGCGQCTSEKSQKLAVRWFLASSLLPERFLNPMGCP